MNRRRFLSCLASAALAMNIGLPELRLRLHEPSRPSGEFVLFVEWLMRDMAAGMGMPREMLEAKFGEAVQHVAAKRH